MADRTNPEETAQQVGMTHYDPVAAFGLRPASERDPWEAQLDIVARMLAATSVEELFAVHEGDNSQAMIGHRLELQSVTWDTYDSDKGPIPMAKIVYIDQDTGEKDEFRTTSLNLTGFVRSCEQHALFPVKVKVEGVKTRSDQTALRFARP